MKRFLLQVISALSLFALISCILEGEKHSGRGSEVENEVHGILVATNGKTVAGARVIALPAASASDTDTVVTDNQGRYTFDSLPVGGYNLLGEDRKDSLVVLVPGVEVAIDGKATDAGTDTLRAPGRIRGRLLAGSRGKPGIMAFISSLSRFDVSDDSGRFEISGLPKGAFDVRYNGTGLLIAPDSGVDVLPGQTTILPDKQVEFDPSLSPPEPIGLKAVYDTLNERVLLSWESVPVSDLEGFIVYRDDPAFLDPQPLGGGFTRGTAFVDSLPAGTAEPGGKVLVYRVKSRDKKLNQSLVFSDPVTVRAVSKSLVTSVAGIEVIGTRAGAASPGDSLRMVLRYSNPTRAIARIEWSWTGPGSLDRIASPGIREGADTCMARTGNPGIIEVTASLIDDGGIRVIARTSIQVVEDAPIIHAGPDISVSLGDSVFLQGSGSDGFGVIEKWEWSIGGSAFQPALAGVIRIKAPASAGTLICVLKATDDDGIASMDSLALSVLEDKPLISAGQDTLVSIGDSVFLGGNGSDQFGSILQWDWSIGEAPFTVSQSGRVSFKAPGVPFNLRAILRATDDDGVQAFDTAMVSVILDPPRISLGADFESSIGDTLVITANASDRFGRIAALHWDIGGKGSFVAGDGDTLIALPAQAEPGFRIIAKATDDDGNASYDTVLANVQADPPIARIGSPMDSVFAGDTVALSALKSTDRYGKVLKYEWDPGAKGVFSVAGAETTVVIPAVSGSYRFVVRVTDDDGQTGLDTLALTVFRRGGVDWIKLASWNDAQFMDARACVFEGKIWIAGPSQTRYSADGRNWTTIPSNLGLKGSSLTAMNGKLWAIGGLEPDGDGSPGVWTSSNGSDWSSVVYNGSFGFVPRARTTVFDGKIWLAGPTASDAWSSPDGINWTAHPIPFGGFTWPFAVLGDSLWIAGPQFLYSTRDGSAWKAHARIPVEAKSYRPIFQHDGEIWAILGVSNMTGSPGDAWSTKDGNSWTQRASRAAFGSQDPNEAFSFRGAMWMLTYDGIWVSK